MREGKREDRRGKETWREEGKEGRGREWRKGTKRLKRYQSINYNICTYSDPD